MQGDLPKGDRLWDDGESKCWKRPQNGKSCSGTRKSSRVREERTLLKATVFGGTAKSVCCQGRPCAMKTATSGRVLEDCAKATVAEGDRVRKTAGEGERRQKRPCATKAATSSRVPEDCEMRLLPNATVCERRCAKAGKEASAVCERL